MAITRATVTLLTDLAAKSFKAEAGESQATLVYLPNDIAERLYKNCVAINNALKTEKGQTGVISCYNTSIERCCFTFPCPNGDYYFSLISNGRLMLRIDAHDRSRMWEASAKALVA